MPCYYCDDQFVNKDIAVELTLVTMERRESGGILPSGERQTVYAHQECVRNNG